jgi:hypothetical protein
MSYDGKSFVSYIPTAFIIDSLPSFNSKDFNTADLGTNMDPARASRDVSRFFNNCLDRMSKYNITFFVVNHIRPKQLLKNLDTSLDALAGSILVPKSAVLKSLLLNDGKESIINAVGIYDTNDLPSYDISFTSYLY